MPEQYNSDNFSLTIEDSARKRFENLDKKNSVFILKVKKSGCSGYSYLLDQIQEDDINEKYEIFDDSISLYIEKDSKPFLDNTIISWLDESPLKSCFHFENPRVLNTCGCGESFFYE